MRRAGNLMASIADPANLELAFWKASKGKSGDPAVVAFRERLAENLTALRSGILDGTVEVGRHHLFVIHDPKRRTICAAEFPERVLHHAMMNVCEPVFEKKQIDDTFACRKGKGQTAAIARASMFARRYGWYLKLDVRKYFDTVDHEVLRGLLRKTFKDKPLLDLFDRIIDSYCTEPGKGIPIGNLTSQHMANLYLDGLDRFVKERLRAAGYARYMDDFVLWADDKSTLVGWTREIETYAATVLKLALKPAQINRVSVGMPFLGCRLYPSGLKLDQRGRRRFKAKLTRLEWDFDRGVISEKDMQIRCNALVAFTQANGGVGFRTNWLRTRDFGAKTMDSAMSGSNRVLRGGSWNNDSSNCRVANRNNNTPTNTNNNNGFRTVRSSEGSPVREYNSDPVLVLSGPRFAGWQRETADLVPVGTVDSVSSAPGGYFEIRTPREIASS